MNGPLQRGSRATGRRQEITPLTENLASGHVQTKSTLKLTDLLVLTYITPLITKELVDVYLSTPSEKPRGLTPRQREVLQFLAEGRTAKEIANLLHITSRTVEFHKGQILDQLKLKTTADLIKYALTHGIVSTP